MENRERRTENDTATHSSFSVLGSPFFISSVMRLLLFVVLGGIFAFALGRRPRPASGVLLVQVRSGAEIALGVEDFRVDLVAAIAGVLVQADLCQRVNGECLGQSVHLDGAR